MTNIKKYLKKDVDVEELKKDFFDYLVSDGVYGCNSKNIVQKWEDFLNMPATPTLTDDERVILRNLKQFNVIGRGADFIYVSTEESPTYKMERTHLPFAELFQFIENGEEYSIEELLKGE